MILRSLIISIVILNMISCSSYSRHNETLDISNKSDIYNILHFGSLAASSHNTQPWKVDVFGKDSIVIFPDLSRKLNIVDPFSRELFISLGAFVENVDIAANHFGYITDIKVCTNDSTTNDSTFIVISLHKGKIKNIEIKELDSRRILRTPYDTMQISNEIIETLISEKDENIHFISAKSTKGEYIKKKTIEAYTRQARNIDAQDELSRWIRFSNAEAKEKRDGLTTSGMEINGVTGFFVRNFFNPADSKKESFVSKGIEKTRTQAEHCGGWILVNQKRNDPLCWINTGRLIQRMNLKCYNLMIGFHPMTQMIEEDDFEKAANNILGFDGIIQFVARIGYVKNYSMPVSVRRPVEKFTSVKSNINYHSRNP